MFFFLNKDYAFMWLCWVFVPVWAFLQLWREGQASRCCDFCCGARALGHGGSVAVVPGLQSTDSVVTVHGLSCSAACGIFRIRNQTCVSCIGRQTSPLSHQGSPFLSQRFLIPQSGVELIIGTYFISLLWLTKWIQVFLQQDIGISSCKLTDD